MHKPSIWDKLDSLKANKELQPLYNEAKKYKSADEFIDWERKRNSFNLEDSEIQKSIKNKYPNVNILVTENATELNLPKIIVPKEMRWMWIWSKIIKEIIDYSDKIGKRVVLTPSSDFWWSLSRLKEFYKRFWFIENKWKKKDYSTKESFIYTPKSDYKSQLRKIREEATKANKSDSMKKYNDINEVKDLPNLNGKSMKYMLDAKQKRGLLDYVQVNKWLYIIKDNKKWYTSLSNYSGKRRQYDNIDIDKIIGELDEKLKILEEWKDDFWIYNTNKEYNDLLKVVEEMKLLWKEAKPSIWEN
jgi:predicted GNAT family acetyltransferase